MEKLQAGGRLVISQVHVVRKSNFRVSNVDRVGVSLDIKELQPQHTFKRIRSNRENSLTHGNEAVSWLCEGRGGEEKSSFPPLPSPLSAQFHSISQLGDM